MSPSSRRTSSSESGQLEPVAGAEAPMGPSEEEDRRNPVEELSFREAQTALDLCLAQLQDQDLDVERMADLYRRAVLYADRCEAVLQQVEQEVMQWDPAEPDRSPSEWTP